MAPTGPTPTELAYLGGFADGEGYFGWSRTNRICVTNCHLDSLIRFYRAFGGHIYKCKQIDGKRTKYQWNVYGESAIHAADALMPYLYEKRRQAQIMCRLHDYPKNSRQRNYLLNKLKELKHRSWE